MKKCNLHYNKNANATDIIFNVKKKYYINIVAYKYKTSHIMIVYHLLC